MNTPSRFVNAVMTTLALTSLPLTQSIAQETGPLEPPSLQVVPLDSYAGSVNDINNVGEAVGVRDGEGAFYWRVSQNGETIETSTLLLQPYGVPRGETATGITDHDPLDPTGTRWISGQAFDSISYNYQACVWRMILRDGFPLFNSDFTLLYLPQPLTDFLLPSFAANISNTRVVVGWRRTTNEDGTLTPQIAAAWGIRDDGTVAGPIDLPGIQYQGELSTSTAVKINDHGLAVGRTRVYDENLNQLGEQATWWQIDWDGENLTLADSGLFFDPQLYPNSNAFDVNNEGYVSMGNFVIDPSDNFVNLAPLVQEDGDDETYSIVNRINCLNNASPPQIVGEAVVRTKEFGTYARRYTNAVWQGENVLNINQELDPNRRLPGLARDSNSAIYEVSEVGLSSVSAINDAGVMAGQGNNRLTGITVPVVVLPVSGQ